MIFLKSSLLVSKYENHVLRRFLAKSKSQGPHVHPKNWTVDLRLLSVLKNA